MKENVGSVTIRIKTGEAHLAVLRILVAISALLAIRRVFRSSIL